MTRYFKLYSKFFHLSLARAMIYRVDFIVWSLVMIGWFAVTVVFYQLLFANIESLAGWSKGQVFILQGFYYLIEAFTWGLFYNNMRELPNKINQGELDMVLTKPVSAQFMISTQSINIDQLTSFALGLMALWYGLSLEQLTLNWLALPIIGVFTLITAVFIYAAWFIIVCSAFYFERLNNISYVFTSLREFGKYPLAAYQGIIRIILTFVFPIALATTLPAQMVWGEFAWGLIGYFVVFTLVLVGLSNLIFRTAVRQYSSASS